MAEVRAPVCSEPSPPTGRRLRVLSSVARPNRETGKSRHPTALDIAHPQVSRGPDSILCRDPRVSEHCTRGLRCYPAQRRSRSADRLSVPNEPYPCPISIRKRFPAKSRIGQGRALLIEECERVDPPASFVGARIARTSA